MVVGVAGSMPVHGMGTAHFVFSMGGKEYVLLVHNCLFCHGEDCFNLISVSQMLRGGQNKVVFSQHESQILLQEDITTSITSIPLREVEGLYEIQLAPLHLGDDRLRTLPRLHLTMEVDPRLWEKDVSRVESAYAGMKSPTRLGSWHCELLWTSCKIGLGNVKDYEDHLNEFCESYFVPPSQPPARKTYQTTDIQDMADLSLRFMGAGTDRLKHTLARSLGLTPASKKKGESVSVVPPHNFPQGKWKSGKTPRVTKGKVKNLHRASIAEACFTDTFETGDSAYKYGQAIVDYRSRYGDIIPIRSRKKVGWAVGQFCCRHFVPLILIRDNIAENVGGELAAECHRRGIKSAYSCPYIPQQDYAEGYLGRVTAMASFAMVLAGAPIFMWRWAIMCAVFINNITASYYTKERVWATPWELVHGEPFPDSSIVIPFGCAALVLLNKEEREKFKGTCAMMIFVHYALDHPLYTFALFSPRTKRILYRQDVIFLPNLFPMREARTKGGFSPDGEALVVYRPPQVPGIQQGEDLSFGGWVDEDPLPAYQDHVTGYPLLAPNDEMGTGASERPLDWPTRQPSHPSFGPPSVVKVPLPWRGDGNGGKHEDCDGMGSAQMGSDMMVCNDMSKDTDQVGRDVPLDDHETNNEMRMARPRRVAKERQSSQKEQKRIPVHQRWYYEPAMSAVAQDEQFPTQPSMNNSQEERGEKSGRRVRFEQEVLLRDERKLRSAIDKEGRPLREDSIGALGSIVDRKPEEISRLEPPDPSKKGRETRRDLGELGARGGQGAKTKDKNVKNVSEITMSQSTSFVPEVKKEILLNSGSEKHSLTSFSSKSDVIINEFENFSRERTGMGFLGPELPDHLGPTELVPDEQLKAAVDNEETACNLQGMVFYDDELGWCLVTNWGVDFGTNILFYAPVSSSDLAVDEQHSALSEVLTWIKLSPVAARISNYRSSRRLSGSSCKKAGIHRVLSVKRSVPEYGTMHVQKDTGFVSRVKALPTKILRRILKTQETLFKYGTLIPRSDKEAEASPEAIRWRSGRQLEWLRLLAAKTFETNWTWERIRKEYPEYTKSEIGHMFYVYDYKYSGEHRVRLVFDGSRQSPNTYSITYAPTVRSESVRLFHLYAVEYGWPIQQYDVPQAFLRSDADCTIFVYPPKGQSDFPGQILKLSKMLYGSKQAAALWYNLLNSFLLKLGFVASVMDPCFYRRVCLPGTDINGPRSDAIIILHVDDMRVAAPGEVLKIIHDQLFVEFQITTSDSGRFLGMDTDYNIDTGVFKMHMATYIDSTVDRFTGFDLSKGIPYRELVGSLLWIVLCVMGTELLRVKDLARRSNNFTEEDYNDALSVLDRIRLQKDFGIIFRRGGAGREYVPACTRLGGGLDDLNDSNKGMYSTGDFADINELEETNLYKLDPLVDDESLELTKTLADTNSRFTKVAYTDASFAVGEQKQSVSGFIVMINGVPILWGSLKQTIVVDSTCSAEYVAASVCCKQVMQLENMVQFLDFTCPRPYKMYTDSQACLKIATTASKMGMVRHLEIRYHLVRCIVLLGDIELTYCITEEMLADLFTKIVASAQDKRLSIRFYNDCVMD
jgi:hypothetical protein